MREKLFEGLKEEDKKLLEEYLDSKKNTGKSEAEILKDATGKAGLFVLFMMTLLVISIFAVIFLVYGGEIDKIKEGAQKLISKLYPRFANIGSFNSTSSEL